MTYVYVVTSTMGDDMWAVHAVFRDIRKARRLKEKLEKDTRISVEIEKRGLRK